MNIVPESIKAVIETEAENYAGDTFYEDWNTVYEGYKVAGEKWFLLGISVGNGSLKEGEIVK